MAHPEWSKDIGGLRAVEPSAGMRDVFVRTVSDERVVAQEGSFDQTGVEAGQTDLVVVAQVFILVIGYARHVTDRLGLGLPLVPGF